MNTEDFILYNLGLPNASSCHDELSKISESASADKHI